MRASLLALLKSLAVAVCIVMAFQGKPPAQAQAVQDVEISQLNQHLAHTDGVVDADEKRLRDIELQMSEMQGEARAAFLILGVLSGGSIILQIRVKRKES